MIDFTKIKKLTIGGVELKQLFINGVQVWKGGYKNWVKFSTEADGETIYNNGQGYKDGYRIRSSGAEATQTGARITGYIPVRAGDIVRCTGWNFKYSSAANAINYYKSVDSAPNTESIGQFTAAGAYTGICTSANSVVTLTNGVYAFTVPNDASIRWLRFTAQNRYQELPADMIVTVNEEID